MEQTKITITKNQAESIRAEFAEINQMQQILQAKFQSSKRMTDAIIKDAGKDPSEFEGFPQLEEIKGEHSLVLRPTVNGQGG